MSADSKKIKMLNADTFRDYIFVDNAAKAIVEISLNNKAKGILNLGSNKCYKVRDIIRKFSDHFQKEICTIEFGERMAEDPLELILNMDKTKKYISKETWENIYNKDQVNYYLSS